MEPISKNTTSGSSGGVDDEISLAELAGVLFKYRWTVFTVFLASMSLAGTYAALSPPVYNADVLMHVKNPPGAQNILADLQLDTGFQPNTRAMEEILKSRTILGQVVDDLGLQIEVKPHHFPFVGPTLYRNHDGRTLAEPPFGLAGYAWGGERMSVGQLTVPDDYLGVPLIVETGEEGRYVLSTEEGDSILEGRVGESAEAEGFRIALDELVARPGTYFRLRVAPRYQTINRLRDRLRISSAGGKTLGQENIVRLQYEDNDPKQAAAIANRIAQHYVDYNIRQNTEEAEKTIAYIEQQLESLSKDVTFDNSLYFMLMTKAQELKVLKAGIVGSTHIVDPAVEPRNPVKPKRMLITALASIAGLLAGVFLAFLRQALDRTVHDPEELEVRSGIEVYGVIPKSRAEKNLTRSYSLRFSHREPPRLLSEHAANDMAVEGLRYLRTAFHYHMRGKNSSSVVVIAGTTANVGKTFVSTNLAYLLAESGKRVALLDADMHRGRAYEYFAKSRSLGLADYLDSNAELDQVIHESRVSGLSIIPPGAISTSYSSTLENGRLHALLEQLRTRFDVVIVDTPPLLAVADSVVIARESDAVILVTRAGQTVFSDISASLRRLLQAGVQPNGVVLNDMPFSSRGYGAYGGYAHVPDYLIARGRAQDNEKTPEDKGRLTK